MKPSARELHSIVIAAKRYGDSKCETKSLSMKEEGLDASTDQGLTERSEEVFLLDILSHRMSEIGMFRQLCPPNIDVR